MKVSYAAWAFFAFLLGGNVRYWGIAMAVNENSNAASVEREREVSIRAWGIISRIYNALSERCRQPIDDAVLQQLNRFCVRLVFCLYADDAGLFAKGQFLDYLRRASTPDGKRALLLTLFRALNLLPEQRDPFDAALLAFPHVNGGLFAGVEKDFMPLFDDELCALIENEAAAGFNWADISPTIFGGLFESTINPKTRRMGGMHYTSVENIHKVIDPLFLDDLKSELAGILARKEKSGTARARKLKAFCRKLASLTFLDPACGSGNFLTETFISLRRLENEALHHLADGQMELDLGALVSINQFYGIEINDFAVAVAKTALWIASAQMWKKTQEFTTRELPDFLPLESYDNIREANALAVDWTENVPGQHLDYVISNPPFVGARFMEKTQKADLMSAFRGVHGAGDLDYVACWFLRAAQLMQADPAVRTALVATNSVVQGQSVALLWRPLTEKYGVRIDFAYRTFRWTNEARDMAAVHCVIVGMTAQEPSKCIIFNEQGEPHPASQINGYLADAPNIFIDKRSRPLCDVPEMGTGNQVIDGGNYLFTPEEKEAFLKKEPGAAPYFRQWLGARELLRGEKRYCLWLGDASPTTLRQLPHCTERIGRVRAFRLKSKRESTLRLAERPRNFQIENMPQGTYIVVPVTSSKRREYIPIAFSDGSVLCSDGVKLVPDAGLYHFGILTSAMHMAWMRTVAGRLKSDYSYSVSIVYNNFPWPEPTAAQHKKIEACAQAVLDTRDKYPDSTLADLYDPLLMPPELRKVHKALDAAVDVAYGRKFLDEVSRVAHLFTLYERLNR